MKIKSYKQLTHQKWLNLYDVTFSDKNGLEKSWQLASRAQVPKCISGDFKKPDAVIIVPLHTETNKIVITKEYRVPLGGFEYGFPAGLLDAGESLQDAARRELKEETGLTITRFIKNSQPVYSSAGMTDESVSMAFVECEGEPSHHCNTASEQIKVELISQRQASDLCQDAHLKFDAKAWLVLCRFAETGEL